MQDIDTTKLTERELELYNYLSSTIAALNQRVRDLENTVASKQKLINSLANEADDKFNKAMRCNSGQRVIRKQIVEDNDTWMG